MNKSPIPSTDEAWEERALGADENYVKAVDEAVENEIDEAAGTHLVSIRMQKAMIEDLKVIGALNGGLGYQTLMKQILQRFIDGEKKQLWNSMVAEKLKAQQPNKECATKAKQKQRKAA